MRHLVGVEVTLLRHLRLETGDGGLIGEDAERAGHREIGVCVEQRGRLDRGVTDRRVVGEADCGQRPAEADRDGIDLGCAGDLTHHPDRIERTLPQIVRETQVAHGRIGVAVADREAGMAVLHRPLDQALPGRQVHDVVLVDPRRAEQQGHRVHSLDLWLVLDQLDQLAPVHDCAGSSGHVHAYLIAGAVDLRRPSAVVAEVGQHVLRTACHAHAAGGKRLAYSCRVAGKRVGRRQRVDDELRRKTRLSVLLVFQRSGIQQFGDELACQQVLLFQQEVQRIVGICRVGESLVAGSG